MKTFFKSLPIDLIYYIDSFYNPYKHIFNQVITEIKQKRYHSVCMKQLKSYNLYDINKNIIQFQKEYILN